MVGKVQKLHVELHPTVLPTPDHVLHVVVEHFRGNTAQVRKGPDVRIQEALQGTPGHKLGIQGPGVAKNKDKK